MKLDDLREAVGELTVPVGIDKRSVKPVSIDMKNKYIYPIMANDSFVLEPFVGEFVKAVDLLEQCRVQIFDCEGWCKNAELHSQVITADFDAAVDEIFEDVLARNNGYKAANMDESFLDQFEQRFIVVIGIEKLTNRLGDKAKERLFAMLQKGKAMYKVHFLFFEGQSYYAANSYTEWYKAHIKANEGLFVGDGFADQYSLKANKHSNSFYEEIGNDFGYLLSRGKPTLTKLLTTEEEV
ncbi:MAG: hypothetical protein IJ168_04965 [Eubacterium sp.]|nr:hypothetical protein [Eubacterium sp.]